MKTFIKNYFDGKVIDITDRKAIIWGIGENAIKISYLLQIDTYEYVIDSNTKRIGEKVVLFDEEYCIANKEVLLDLESNNYFIIVGSNRYCKEIIDTIIKIRQYDFPVCASVNDYVRKYSNLRKLINCEPIVLKKIIQGNVSLKVSENIGEAQKIIDKYLQSSNKLYKAIEKGFGISFIIEVEQEEFVMHLPTHNVGLFEKFPTTCRFIREKVIDSKKRLHINEKIIIYEDEYGYSILRKCKEIYDWKIEKYIEGVLKKISEVHNSNLHFDYYDEMNFNFDMFNNYLSEIVSELSFVENVTDYLNSIIVFLNNQKKVLCHNDLIPDNIVLYDDSIEIIDWEGLRMGNPYIDIGRFFVLLELDYNIPIVKDLEKWMEIYLGKRALKKELEYERIALIYCILLESVGVRDKNRNNRSKELLKKQIKLLHEEGDSVLGVRS